MIRYDSSDNEITCDSIPEMLQLIEAGVEGITIIVADKPAKRTILKRRTQRQATRHKKRVGKKQARPKKRGAKMKLLWHKANKLAAQRDIPPREAFKIMAKEQAA